MALVDEVQVIIADSGSWNLAQPTTDPSRVRGIAIIRALMHDVTIDQGATGTTVHLSARIA